MRHARNLSALALTAAGLLLLSGCAALFGPARDADGRVTETTEVNSTELLVGDCFSFVDGTDHARASLTPCGDTHTHIVIGQGELSDSDVTTAGNLQNAVSSACAEDFDAFKAAAAEGVKPEQEFIVAVEDRDGKNVTVFACVATDGEVLAEG